MEEWITIREAANLLGKSPAAIRYRTLKAGKYEHKREPTEYTDKAGNPQEVVMISTRSLIEKHPELKEKLEDYPKPPVNEDASTPSYETQFVGMAPAPEDGPRTMSVQTRTSVVGAARLAHTDRIRTLLDELEEIQKREQEIKTELKTLMESL